MLFSYVNGYRIEIRFFKNIKRKSYENFKVYKYFYIGSRFKFVEVWFLGIGESFNKRLKLIYICVNWSILCVKNYVSII